MSKNLAELKERVDAAVKKTTDLQSKMTGLTAKRAELDKVKNKSDEQTKEIALLDQDIAKIYSELMTAATENTLASQEFTKALVGEAKKEEEFLSELPEGFMDFGQCPSQERHCFFHGMEVMLILGAVAVLTYLYMCR